jgi:ubiquinone/menaquinone biosynthesis C-methylase UbiE
VLASFIASLNKIFRKPRVEGRESAKAYSDWEYRMGRGLVAEYLEPKGDLKGKKILDIGCGLGGKTVAYSEGGASEVIGVDLIVDNVIASQRYCEQRVAPSGRPVRAERQRARLGCSATLPGQAGPAAAQPRFLVADAARLPIADGRFDTVVANDAMEHFAEPEAALREMVRVTKGGGTIWLFFTPHFSPLGSHLYDYIYIPWCHLVFTRRDLEGAIQRVLHSRAPDVSNAEIRLQTKEIMRSFDEDLNQMGIRRFFGIVRRLPGIRVSLHEFKPAKYSWLKVLTMIPLIRELFTGTVVCRLERMG